jgi:hypothetical protein
LSKKIPMTDSKHFIFFYKIKNIIVYNLALQSIIDKYDKTPYNSSKIKETKKKKEKLD